jgi:tRNA(Ile)-lysidine synthase
MGVIIMITKVLKTIKKNGIIKRGDSIVVGVSGGPDSVCLLHILSDLKKDLNLKLVAVHINHMLRGSESNRDEDFVKKLCEDLNIEFKSMRIDINKISKEKGISLEEAGREERYKNFGIIADSIGADKIAVAHNKNDQAETVLMNIIRGAGFDGLKGLDYIRGRIIRPLLDIERSEIDAYILEKKIDTVTDSSNFETIYARNKIRLEVIPNIDKLFGSNLVKSIDRMNRLIKDDIDFIDSKAKKSYFNAVLKKENEEVELLLGKMKRMHIALKRRVIRKAICEVRGNVKGIESVHIESVLDMINGGRVGSRVDLPGIKIRRTYESIRFYKTQTQPDSFDFEANINMPGSTELGDGKHLIEAKLISDYKVSDYKWLNARALTQFFDYDKVCEGINIRKRKEGDIFKPINSNGTKKLKEYFIDKKIPREMRDNIPLIAKEREIIWIIGYKISDKFKVTENTKRVLKLSYKSNLQDN